MRVLELVWLALRNDFESLLGEVNVEGEDSFNAKAAHHEEAGEINEAELTAIGREKLADTFGVIGSRNPVNLQGWCYGCLSRLNSRHAQPSLNECTQF